MTRARRKYAESAPWPSFPPIIAEPITVRHPDGGEAVTVTRANGLELLALGWERAVPPPKKKVAPSPPVMEPAPPPPALLVEASPPTEWDPSRERAHRAAADDEARALRQRGR